MTRFTHFALLVLATLGSAASVARPPVARPPVAHPPVKRSPTPFLDAEVRRFIEADPAVVRRSMDGASALPHKPLAKRAAEGRQTRHLRPVWEKRQDAVDQGARTNFSDGDPQPVRGKNGATFLGGSNHEIDKQNVDNVSPPPTDAGLVPNLKWSMSLSHSRLTGAGWVREQLIQDLPASKDFAAAEIRLGPNAYRELHWHRVAEWGYILGGSGRIVAVDEKGRNYAADINGPKDGQDADIYVFPVGVPHSIQAFDDGLEILLIFSDGDFEKAGTTFHLSDWVAHTPLEILAQNFGVNSSVFEKVPQKNPYIFNSTKPPPQEGHSADLDQRPKSPDGLIEQPYAFRIKDQKKEDARGGGGYMKIQTSDTNFPPSKEFATGFVSVEPRGLREMHWNTKDEWIYIIQGHGRASVYMGGANARTFDFQTGDTGVFPAGVGHYMKNVSKNETLIYLEVFKSETWTEYTATQWLALMPRQHVADLLNISVETVESFQSEKQTLIAEKPQ